MKQSNPGDGNVTLQERARDLSAHQRTYLGASPLTDLLCEMADTLDAREAEIGRYLEITAKASAEIASLQHDNTRLMEIANAEVAVAEERGAEIARLREALTIAMEWINGWDPNFILDDDWPADKAKIMAALSPQEDR